MLPTMAVVKMAYELQMENGIPFEFSYRLNAKGFLVDYDVNTNPDSTKWPLLTVQFNQSLLESFPPAP